MAESDGSLREQLSLEPWLVSRLAAAQERQGMTLNLGELLALGPEPRPSRPAKPLRCGVGLTLAYRCLGQTDPG